MEAKNEGISGSWERVVNLMCRVGDGSQENILEHVE